MKDSTSSISNKSRKTEFRERAKAKVHKHLSILISGFIIYQFWKKSSIQIQPYQLINKTLSFLKYSS